MEKRKSDVSKPFILILLEHLTFAMQYYLYGNAVKKKLPLQIRPSFGFPQSVIIECGNVIRLAVGLEEAEMLDGYRDMLFEINEELKGIIHPGSEGAITILNDFFDIVKFVDWKDLFLAFRFAREWFFSYKGNIQLR